MGFWDFLSAPNPPQFEVAIAEPPIVEAAPVSGLPTLSMSATLEPEDAPKFKRTYKAVLTKNAAITVSAYSSYYRSIGEKRYFSGELTQPNGRWVIFDPDRIADKILDPALVPLVEAAVDAAKVLDREFMASNPSSFVDERKDTWQRLSGS